MHSIQAGDRIPFCYGMTADRRFYSFEEQAGRPAVMILAHQVRPNRLHAIIANFTSYNSEFTANNADFLLLADEDVVRDPEIAASAPFRLIDCGIRFLDRCGVAAGTAAVMVTDRNLRLALRQTPGPETPAACLACLQNLPRELPAPVLILPNLLPRALCRTLIERFEASISIDGEVASIGSDGRPQARVDHARKRRRDLLLSLYDPLHPVLQGTLLRRCAPEIARAFQAAVTHTDRILVARYDEAAGWFRRHRDNTADNVAFREFAISVNLNTEDYEGGYLQFPEYNDRPYSPPTGGALIFSASILHEALPVSGGNRYVLLTFFHGETAEARRRAYVAQTSAPVMATA
jgi:predicted 2-oxoglutarate/Fe(II)-dependent dioxygenase YbiX